MVGSGCAERYIQDLTTYGSELPWDLEQGESATLDLMIPTGPDFQIDESDISAVIGVQMVHEGVAWFGPEVQLGVDVY